MSYMIFLSNPLDNSNSLPNCKKFSLCLIENTTHLNCKDQ